MLYTEAREIVRAERMGEDKYLQIHLTRFCVLVLPYEEGVVLLRLLARATKLDPNVPHPTIENMASGDIAVNLLSAEDYERYRIAHLLQSTYEKVRELEKLFPE